MIKKPQNNQEVDSFEGFNDEQIVFENIDDAVDDREEFLIDDFLAESHTQAHQRFLGLELHSLTLGINIGDAVLGEILDISLVKELAQLNEVAKHGDQ